MRWWLGCVMRFMLTASWRLTAVWVCLLFVMIRPKNSVGRESEALLAELQCAGLEMTSVSL